MTSEMEQTPMLFMASCSQHRSQWVNEKPQFDWLSYHTISANREQWLWIIYKMVTLSRFSEVPEEHFETNGLVNSWQDSKEESVLQFVDFYFQQYLKLLEKTDVCMHTQLH